MLERLFALEARGTTVRRELRGSLATFLTMAYILFANPTILAGAGIPYEAAVAATALAAAACSLLMGAVANFPLALASGMGLNAVVAFQIAPALGSWQAAMGLVILDGIVVLLLVLAGLREAVMHAIPRDLRRAIGVGIGLFITLIGLVNARLVVVPASTVMALGENATAALPPVSPGTLRAADPAIALFGLILIAWLLVRRTTGALIIGIGACTIIALATGLSVLPQGGWLALPSFETIGQADLRAALTLSAIPLLLSLVMVDFFDTIGTVSAIAEEAGLQDDEGRVPNVRRILSMDAISASIGGWFGASSATAYIESAAGVAEGARSGLHSVGVAVLFLLAMFIAPLLAIVPAAATAPALITVGFLMCQQITRIDFKQLDTAIPAFILLTTIPFTWSISHGIGYGFIAYTVIKLLTRRFDELHPLMAGTAVAFVLYFVFGH